MGDEIFSRRDAHHSAAASLGRIYGSLEGGGIKGCSVPRGSMLANILIGGIKMNREEREQADDGSIDIIVHV